MRLINIMTGIIILSTAMLASADEPEPREHQTLAAAIRDRDVASVRRMIDQGATFNTSEVWQDALNTSSPDEMFALFLEKGFDPAPRPDDFVSPLYYAAAKGRLEVVRMLLKRGADVNAAGTSGITPLMGAAGASAHSVRADVLVDELLKAGAKADISDTRGRTPLHFAARTGGTNAKAVIDLLLKAGAEVDASDEEGQTSLMLLSVSTADRSAVWSLLTAGADVNAQDKGGNAPLHYAVWPFLSRDTNLGVIGYLFNNEADPNLANKSGWTPVMVASASPSLDKLQELLARGGKADTASKQGWTPVTIAIAAADPTWWARWLKTGEMMGIPQPNMNEADAKMVGAIFAGINRQYSPKVWLLLMYGADATPGKGPKYDKVTYDTQRLLTGRDNAEAKRTIQLLKLHRENPLPIEKQAGQDTSE